MSLALARKYRPTTFDDLIGQEAVSQTLSLALDGDRLSHAYLFSGLRGSGKTSTARIFAKALLCEEGASSHPCEKCTHCLMSAQNSHMDIIEMDAASNRGIDDIKDLIEHTKYKPSSARYKIFIIDEVHMLTNQAFNALLKTLEEPPDFVKFILATTDPLKLPATILSRTQHFRFKKIPQNLVLKHLEHILNLEKIEYEKEALEIIARTGAGSLRDSLTLLDQAIVYSKNFVDMNTVTNMLGIIEPSLLEGLVDDILNKDENKILDFVRLASDYESEMILDEFTLHLKELLLTKSTKLSPMIIERFFRIIADSKSLLSLGTDGEFVLTLTLFKMIEALNIKDIDGMIRTLEKELSGIEPTKEREIGKEKEPSIAKEEATEAPARNEVITITEDDISMSESKATKEKKEDTVQPETKEETEEAPPIENPPLAPAEEKRFSELKTKIFDRDYDLGKCFEENITFESFENNTLSWCSTAEEEDKKQLRMHWGIVNGFVKEIFGLETKINNISKKKIKEIEKVPAHEDSISASTVEEIITKSSCIAPSPGGVEAAKEKDPSSLLDEPMIKEAIALFDPKKVRVKRNS